MTVFADGYRGKGAEGLFIDFHSAGSVPKRCTYSMISERAGDHVVSAVFTQQQITLFHYLFPLVVSNLKSKSHAMVVSCKNHNADRMLVKCRYSVAGLQAV